MIAGRLTLALAMFAATSGTNCLAQEAPAASPTLATTAPDILWIVTDDHRPDSIRAFNRATRGQEDSPLGHVESPNADRLAAEGVMFTNAYNQAPTCGPSRTSMITGRYPFRNGKYGWENTHQTAGFVRPAFPQVLQSTGYTTALVGKTHYGIRPCRKFRWNALGRYDDIARLSIRGGIRTYLAA